MASCTANGAFGHSLEERLLINLSGFHRYISFCSFGLDFRFRPRTPSELYLLASFVYTSLFSEKLRDIEASSSFLALL